jgi:phage-related protein
MRFRVILLSGADEFIHSLSPKLEAKALRAIDLLQQFGYLLKEPHSKILKDAEGMKELRIKVATDICRLFYFHHMDMVYIITSGYVKKEDSTSREEIDRALRLKAVFLERYDHEDR